VKLLFTDKLWDTFAALTRAARGYVPADLHAKEPAIGFGQFVDAAVRFTVQLAIDAAEYDQVQAHDLESALIIKLASWIDEEGARALRLWTHDMSCVIGALTHAAHHFAYPRPGKDVVQYVLEIRPRNLAVAAVAFTIQLALEETELPVAAMRELENALMRKLEAPWELDYEIPLSVDTSHGPTWESLAEKDRSG
jgi:hypothetical protein